MTKRGFPLHLTMEWLQIGYKSGALTPEDVMLEIIRRAEADSDMNVWITPPSMAVLKPYLERLIEMDPANAPLWGIPFAIKDNIDVAGIPTTAGCSEFAYTPVEHAAVVERLVAAGAIPLGKTNLDQFATGLVGTRSPYGEAHNALRPELISGGSSSGSAVAAARGHAVFSLGTDTAGSGRVPAALNELVGYKPSLGSWPVKGVVPACASLDCVTVFAHSLEEALIVDGIARGIHENDPWSRDVKKQQPKLPAKLCLPKQAVAFFGPFAEQYERAWHAAIGRLEQLNLPIEYVDYDLFSDAAAILYGGPWVAERWADLSGFIDSNPGVAFPVTERILRSGAAAEHDAASVFSAMHKLQAYKLEARKLLQDAVLVMPTCGGTWTREQVRKEPYSTNSDMGRYTNHCNLLDLCAVAVPSDAAEERLPFGITLFALAENEHLMNEAARSFLSGGERAAAAVPVESTRSVSARTGFAAEDIALEANTVEPSITVAVCGLHMRGYPLEKQMIGLNARFMREASSAPRYKLVKLPTTPAKPGMIKQLQGGASIELELWEMSPASFGIFTSLIPAPLGIGKVELLDGTEVSGFVCEAYAAAEAEDITAYGGWRRIPQS
ncbi:allophanate hydrolase [Paenibacillus sp. LHD-38]|uniref:allophanate hydrolase n=1 Tax=Paenibacillus sp. LHD-38 TaxID=3072143 RepID=UPI00280E5337|nr:allophanate hydrolase [Paenibacillus sp. LHD-38]MDQ8733125.1 allophanate hydrolase [Paenibacillus sp. LHD-38]